MKRILAFAVVALVIAACVNTNKKPKAEPDGPAGEPAVEASVQETAPSQALTPVKEDKPAKEEQKSQPQPEEVDVNSLTVDALCNQYGVYDLLDQYKQHIQSKDKKAAKEVQTQLGALKKQIKNDQTLPQDLRDSFKTYVEDKEEEIKEHFK